jgi:hypothetical protein
LERVLVRSDQGSNYGECNEQVRLQARPGWRRGAAARVVAYK